MSMSMSLGLKQLKPKISYMESISNLKKKPAAPQKPEPELEKPEESKKEEKVEINEPEKL